ncbi:DUF6682 family protein [Vibrio astriarenae]
MAAVTSILSRRIRTLLRDSDREAFQWSDDELLGWLNDAVRTIAGVIPQAVSVSTVIALQAGVRQKIPSLGSVLLEIFCNIDADGFTEGRAIRRLNRKQLDIEDANWRTHERGDVVEYYCPSLTDPKVFDVYPPSNGNHFVLASYAKAIPEFEVTDEFPIPDVYIPVCVDYVCYRAWGKLIESADARARAGDFQQSYQAGLAALSGQYTGRESLVSQPIT